MVDSNRNYVLSLKEFRNCTLKDEPLKYFADLMRNKEK